MQFFGKFFKIVCCPPPFPRPGGLAPSPWGNLGSAIDLWTTQNFLNSDPGFPRGRQPHRGLLTYCYHLRMRVDNVFSHVCLCVCLCVCLSVCVSVCLSVFLSVQAITFEPLDIETSFLACRYILTISRLNLSIKVIGSRSRSYEKKW